MAEAKAEILLVDDVPANLRLLLSILEREGYRVRCVSSGTGAIAEIENNPPQLILLDVVMPDMNGYDLCERLKANSQTQHIPVIFISIMDKTIDKVKAFRVGGADYITKPFQWEEVVARIENQLQIEGLQKQLMEKNARLQQEIRDRAEVERELQQLNQEIKRSNRELEQFAYVVSHDLQAPLGTVASFAQLLQRRYESQLDAKANQFLDKIISGTVRMQRLIGDLLEYSRLGNSAQTFEAIDCQQVLSLALENLDRTIQDTGAIVTHDELAVVMGNPVLLVQLFQNAIGNAIKYRRPQIPPTIHIGISPREEAWLFSIQDNGIGIDSKHKDRIFQIFQRLHTESEYPGTGIGLAICHKIVELHGGRIWVESVPGEGSTFHFTILRNLHTTLSERGTKDDKL